MELSLRGTILSLVLLVVVIFPDVHAKRPKFQPGPWKTTARATFYGGPDGSGTYDGACGYGELQKQGKGYGVQTVAISTYLFEKGAACGSCWELKCEDTSKGCKPGAGSIIVTATNECPDSGWGQEHFDLTQPAFGQLGEYKAGILPIHHRRVPCVRTGGIRFTISKNSNPYYLLVMISNVAGAGDVRKVMVKGDKGKPFIEMTRDWGQNWVSHEGLVGQSMTFRVITSDGRKATSWHVAPQNWQFGQTFEGKNFK